MRKKLLWSLVFVNFKNEKNRLRVFLEFYHMVVSKVRNKEEQRLLNDNSDISVELWSTTPCYYIYIYIYIYICTYMSLYVTLRKILLTLLKDLVFMIWCLC